MLQVITIGFTLLACYLLFKLFINTCKVGVLGAIIGAIVCIFVPYELKTCALWGFCIGMVFQFITNWERMLIEIICAAVGLGIALIVYFILKFCGVPYDYSSPISLLIWIGFWCLGSSDAAEEVANSFDFSSITPHLNFKNDGKVYDHPTLNGTKRGLGIENYENESNRCHLCGMYGDGFCSLHKTTVDAMNGCADFT